MTRIRRDIPLLLAIVITAFGITAPLFATHAQSYTSCCTCVLKDNPGGYTCAYVPDDEGGANCAGITSKYPNMKGYNCTAPESADYKCASKTGSNSGVCSVGPIDVRAIQSPDAEVKTTPLSVIPVLEYNIPGLTFSSEADAQGRQIGIPFFAQYISAVYRYMIGIAAIAAAVMIVYGGFLMILSQTGAKVRQGREIVTDAIIGLFLVLGAYLILDALNPNLTKPGALVLDSINPIYADDTAAIKKLAEAAATIPSQPKAQLVPIIDLDQAVPASTTPDTTPPPNGIPGTIATDLKGNLIAQGECPTGMVPIPQSKRGSLGNVPSFCIDIYEAPNIPGRIPFGAVTEWEADWYCKESGKRLCSVSEWQRACVGPQGTNLYGYGPNFIEGSYVSAGVPMQGTVKNTGKPPAPCNYDTVAYTPLPPTLSFYFASRLLTLKKPEYSMLSKINPWADDPQTKAKYKEFQQAREASNHAEPSGSRPCVTEEGVHDMIGNLQEIAVTDSGARLSTDERVAMGAVGGSAKPYRWLNFFWSPVSHLADTKATPTCTQQWGTDHTVNERAFENGFRCCMNLQE